MDSITKKQATDADQKIRWGGILENPFISSFQRGVLDGGRMAGFKKALSSYPCKSVLDVGCGFGEGSKMHEGFYCGLDNSIRRVSYAKVKYKGASFLMGDAYRIPFKDDSFEMAILSNTAHHLNDAELKVVLAEMVRVSCKYIIVNESIVREDQNLLSAFFYNLDRGGHYRTLEHMRRIILSGQRDSVIIEKETSFWTFPGIYFRTVFICKLK